MTAWLALLFVTLVATCVSAATGHPILALLSAVVFAGAWLLMRKKYITPRPPGAAAFDALRARSGFAKQRGDFDEAERLLMAAVNAGDPEAMFDMGRLVEQRDGIEASRRWFQMAAEHGHKVALMGFEPGEAFNPDGLTPLAPRGPGDDDTPRLPGQ